MRKLYTLTLLLSTLVSVAQSPYMSRSQPVPFGCPVVCPGSVIVLDVPQVQDMNVGDTIQAWLSNYAGSFSSGTSTLTPIAYSLNTGTTWTNGPYIYSADVNNLYLQVVIPNIPVGSNYTILMKTSSGFVASDYFSCSGTDSITVTAAYTTLAAQPDTTVGNNQWIGHVYTWVPTTSATLSTVALVDSQDFYDPVNYQGFFLKDSLSFDINWLTSSGGTCPGTPGVLNDGTSIPCSEGWTTDFSVQFLRRQNFTPGTYKLSVQGDDGIRLSIDGGNTWLIGSFFEQTYPNGYASTDTLYPNGICLSGPTDLVIDYFERNVDSRATFTATMLSSLAVGNTGNQTVCSGANASFPLTGSGGTSFQWYYSTDGGNTYNPIPNNLPFSGVTSATLGISNVQPSFNNYLFKCSVTGLCNNPVYSNVDTLFVSSSLNLTPSATPASCGNNNGTATVTPGGTGSYTYTWSNSGNTQTISNLAPGTYTVTVSAGGGCSSTASVTVTASGNLTLTPSSTPASCGNNNGTATVTPGSSGSYTYAWSNSGNTQTISNLAAGTYTVTVSAGGGCSATASISVTASGNLTLTPNATSTTCGNNNGAASVTVSGGSGNYDYSWSNSATSASISNLAAGNYTVTVSDVSGGCSGTASVTINPSGTTVTISPSAQTICSGDTAYICAPTGYASYDWNTGDNTACIGTTSAGNYYVTVTDNGGCTATSNHASISTFTPTPVTISVNGDTLSSYSAVSYQWYLNGQPIAGATGQTYVALQDGNYSVQITDNNGCHYTSSVTTVKVAGISNMSADSDIKVFPNPLSNGGWHIDISEALLGSTCMVFDAGGRLVYKDELRSTRSEIYLDAAQGVYVLQIQSAGANYTVKLVKLY